MKVFFDTEFTGLHKNTTLISIGLVSEDGKMFYAEFTDYDKTQVDEWIQKNVIDNLWANKIIQYGHTNHQKDLEIAVGDTKLIRIVLTNWLSQFETVEWISDVCHYDFVLLIDLLCGHALNMPYSKWNSACHDINQDIAEYYDINEIEAFDKSREDIIKGLEIDGIKHNSLYDAKVIKDIYEFVGF